MGRAREIFVLGLVLTLMGALPTSASGPGSVGRTGTGPSTGVSDEEAGYTLVAIRAAHHPGYDRLVFEFDGPVPEEHSISWATKLYYDDALWPPRRAWVAGNAFLRVRFVPAVGLEDNGSGGLRSSYGPMDRAYALPNLAEVKEIGDWEGYLTFGVGLMRKTTIMRTLVLAHPGRFVIDIATDFERTPVREVFYDRDHSRWSSVWRVVPSGNVARGALVRLFAGPTLAERADGLRFIRSGADSFHDLRITNGIARVTLTGGCDSHGSVRTVGTEIKRTLRALPGIDWVKVYDPQGHTQHPTGNIDSIPTCLEP